MEHGQSFPAEGGASCGGAIPLKATEFGGAVGFSAEAYHAKDGASLPGVGLDHYKGAFGTFGGEPYSSAGCVDYPVMPCDIPGLGLKGGFHQCDFYQEEDVTRGVAGLSTNLEAQVGSSGFHHGDPYPMGEQSWLSSGLPADKEPFGYQEPDVLTFGAAKQFRSLDFPPGDVHALIKQTSTESGKRPARGHAHEKHEVCAVKPAFEQFTDQHKPPPVNPDPLFELAATTIDNMELNQRTPKDLGNHLLQFLESRTCSEPKLNHEKFSVKINVFSSGPFLIMCCIKIRVYDKGDGTYALELHKRSGDSLCFHELYQDIRAFFKNEGYSFTAELGDGNVRTAGRAWPPAVPWAPPDCVVPSPVEAAASELGPLLDMASFKDLPNLQAEAAVALADIAHRDANAAQALCDQSAMTKWKQLLQSDELSVAYPTARMLWELANRKETGQRCFQADETCEIMSQMIKKVSSTATDKLVKDKLAQVVKAAVDKCAATFTHQAQTSICAELEVALEASQPFVQEKLRAALATLKGGPAPGRP